MIYEERRIRVLPKRQEEYIQISRKQVWPSLNSIGGKAILLLGGLIGDPPEELVQVTAFPDLEAWQSAQEQNRDNLSELLEQERVRLLRPISSRPKEVIPNDDRRAVYGFRRFFIDPNDLDEFVHCSENGIWPRIEAQGACILGLWTTVASTYPQEIILATGYHSPEHWQQTRYAGPPPQDVDKSLWEKEENLRQRRVDMTIKSWVCLMRAYDV